tara:strand:+ start:1650 stop:2219 length:570 start_codon:yes stop_codon:yes gene_type:complete
MTVLNAKNYLKAHKDLASRIDISSLEVAVDIIKNKFLDNKKIFTCGNGGSASTASHFITDWNKMINLATGKKFRGICLSDNMGLITAFANDFSYDDIFSGQLASIADEGDLLISVSGSGNSKNILKAIKYANDNSITSLSILGYDGGEALKISNHSFLVPSYDMQLCEDVHLKFGHIVMKTLCQLDISD